MEKTVVEWLLNELQLEFPTQIRIIHEDNQLLLESIIIKAKQMEKSQLYNFYIQGGIDGITEADRTVEDYYNETFNK
jgi:hypothetical protein